MKYVFLWFAHRLYRYVVRPILFRIDSERVHLGAIDFGAWVGEWPLVVAFLSFFTRVSNPALTQTVAGVSFQNPIGLAAGFDYEARLHKALPAVGFGFGTIGTITKNAYEGNALPRLGRLVDSRSLLVNKGLKNLGIAATLARCANDAPVIPLGLSIGMTNTKAITGESEAIADILAAFTEANSTPNSFAYYELNISCPNMMIPVSFSAPQSLDALLSALDSLHIAKPLFMKMPIEKDDAETLELLAVIARHNVLGVIFGNLQKNRQDPSLNPAEVAKYAKGYFSGKPTEKRSNELIALAYKNYGQKLVIIGCGGVFSAEDAYTKIKLGASLVQLITGMIFEGPQLIAEINHGLVKLLKQDGFKNVSEAVGKVQR